MDSLKEILIGTHAFLGEAGALAFLWVTIELLANTENGMRRTRIAARLGTAFIFLSWIIGGYYYVKFYGQIKPFIKEGPQPWAHGIITETKEHIFLFLPIVALLTTGIIQRFKNELLTNKSARTATIILSILLVLMVFTIAGFGFLISSGYRAATAIM